MPQADKAEALEMIQTQILGMDDDAAPHEVADRVSQEHDVIELLESWGLSVGFDRVLGMFYLRMTPNPDVSMIKTQEVHPEVHLDVDAETGQLAGVEIFVTPQLKGLARG